MEWESEDNPSEAWVTDGERWICDLPGVRVCRIDLDPAGEVAGVHIVAGIEREPSDIVRDVVDLLKRRLAVDVYFRKIAVVQIVDGSDSALVDSSDEPDASDMDHPEFEPNTGETPAPEREVSSPSRDNGKKIMHSPETEPLPAVVLAEEAAIRVRCSGVGVMVSDTVIRAEVELNADGTETRGVAEGPNLVDADVGLIGRATIEAVLQLIDEPVLLSLGEVKITDIGGQQVAMAAIELVEGRRSEKLFGTCPTTPNRQQSIVYAVLDGLNRRLSLMNLKADSASE